MQRVRGDECVRGDMRELLQRRLTKSGHRHRLDLTTLYLGHLPVKAEINIISKFTVNTNRFNKYYYLLLMLTQF